MISPGNALRVIIYHEVSGLNCLDVGIPGAIDAVFHGLIGRTHVRIDLEGSLCFLQKIFGCLEMIFYSNLGNSQDAVNRLHIPFDMGQQIFSC
jgi:hypothetical protein